MNNSTRIVTEDNSYIIELERKTTIFDSNRSICCITFKTILGSIIASLNISDIEIVNFIDNFSTFLHEDIDIITSFNPDSINGIIYQIGFTTIQDFYNGKIEDNYIKYIMTLYSYNSSLETNTKILSFDITHSSEKIIDLLYEVFIEPNNSQMKEYLLNL